VRARTLLWLIPCGVIVLLGAAILALPAFVASATHRGSIEALASSLTGREVHIGGDLTLELLPAPRLTADDVTITGPDRETITAKALTLNLSLPALLHGRISAETLVLDAPDIAFPWPLPGGPQAIAPPGWLAALHAQIEHGRISLGAAHFTDVDADIFTGAAGAVSASGTGRLAQHDVSLSLSLGPAQLNGVANVTLAASSGAYSLHVDGGLDGGSVFRGRLALASPAISGQAAITADGVAVAASGLTFQVGGAQVGGAATFQFLRPAIDARLTVAGLDASHVDTAALNWPVVPVTIALTATGTRFYGQTIPALQASVRLGPGGAAIEAINASLPGDTSLTGRLAVTAAGALNGRLSLSSLDLSDLLATASLKPPAGWDTAHLSADISGSPAALRLTEVGGTLGGDHVSGALTIGGRHAAGALSFDRLDLAALYAWAKRAPALGFTADGEISAARASLGPVPFTHLLIDGALAGGVNIRRASASLYDGIAAGSLTIDPAGHITAGQAFLSLPSAAPLRSLIPAADAPPAALLAPDLNLTVFVAGNDKVLGASAVGRLGAIGVTAAPVLNLGTDAVSGPLTLRAPSAIAATNIFDLNRGLAWPGAGSVSLRADMSVSNTVTGIPDFVLSFGDLTATGRLLVTKGVLSGDIDAGTLALPPLNTKLRLLAVIFGAAGGAPQGRVAIHAGRVLYAGQPALAATDAILTLSAAKLTLAVSQAALAGGKAQGMIIATLAADAPPALTADVSATHVDASQLQWPVAFPLTLTSGIASLQAHLTASGYSPDIWAATLGGTASLTAANGTLTGISLGDLTQALAAKNRIRALQAALRGGATPFQSLSATATLNLGNCALTTASLSGAGGSVSATGSIDIPDRQLALYLALQPDVSPALTVGTTILGPWSAPKTYPKLRPALAWTQAG